MSGEENTSVEAQESQVVAPTAETEVQEAAPAQAQPQDTRRSDAEYNWAEANRKMRELQQANREMQDQIQRLHQANVKPEEDVKLNDEELPTYADVKKTFRKSKKELKDEIRQEVRAEIAQSTLKLQFPDIDQVVTNENIELLKQQEPELALSLAHNPDPIAKAVAAYKLIKKMGAEPMPKNASSEKEKAQTNAKKPVSVNAVSKQGSALGNAQMFENGLTKELKSQLWSEMREAIKRG